MKASSWLHSSSLSPCYRSSLFQGKKLSFYSGDLPQLYTLSLTSITSCQVSKRKGSEREKCQERKEHNARKANWRGVAMLPGWRIARITITNCQPPKNALPQRLSFRSTSFPFHTIRYLSASTSGAFHPSSIAFNFAVSAVLSKTFKCSIRSPGIFTRSVNAFCVSSVYTRVAFTLFFKPSRFIIASAICPWIRCRNSTCSWTHVLSLAVVSRIIGTRALRKVISVTGGGAETFSAFEDFSLVARFFNWFIRRCLSVGGVWSSASSAFRLGVLGCCGGSGISTRMPRGGI